MNQFNFSCRGAFAPQTVCQTSFLWMLNFSGKKLFLVLAFTLRQGGVLSAGFWEDLELKDLLRPERIMISCIWPRGSGRTTPALRILPDDNVRVSLAFRKISGLKIQKQKRIIIRHEVRQDLGFSLGLSSIELLRTRIFPGNAGYLISDPRRTNFSDPPAHNWLVSAPQRCSCMWRPKLLTFLLNFSRKKKVILHMKKLRKLKPRIKTVSFQVSSSAQSLAFQLSLALAT